MTVAIMVQRSNQLSYEATDVGSWSFVGSNFPVRDGGKKLHRSLEHLKSNVVEGKWTSTCQLY